MMRRMMTRGLAMAATVLGMSGATASADFVYGIDDSNRIHKIDTNSPHSDAILAPAVGSIALSGSANGVALDLTGNRLIFRSSDTGSLRQMDLGTNLITTILGTSNLPGSAASATYYEGAYWYVKQNSDDLIRVDLTGAPSYIKVADFTSNTKNFSFGDIVISTTGTLYGSSQEGFFKFNLSDPTGTYQMLNASLANLQIALLGDGSIIGQQHDGANAGKWYSVSTTGVASYLGYTTTPLRDITGATVPEPASIAMLGLGGVAALAFVGRRRVAA